MAKVHSSMALNMPRVSEKMNELLIDSAQNSGEPATKRSDGLYQTNSNLRGRGATDRFVLEESLYQRAKIHPVISAGILLGGLALAAWLGSGREESAPDEPKTLAASNR